MQDKAVHCANISSFPVATLKLGTPRNSASSENSILPRFLIYQTVQFKSQISVHEDHTIQIRPWACI